MSNGSFAELIAQGRSSVPDAVTEHDIECSIKSVDYYRFPGTRVIVACVGLANGFNVVGHSACVSDRRFDSAVGKEVALAHARSQIWPLLGFQLRERKYQINRE